MRLSLGLLVAAALSGCQSNTSPARKQTCDFVPGMTADDLVDCGCIAAITPNDGAMMLMSEEAQSNTRAISIINYMCPLGAAGVAMVVVKNGVVSSVYE
jgi:hypothetical protein